MSLFGSMMGDFDDDMFMNNPMNMMQMQMRNVNRMMNSLMPDPFNMMMPFDNGRQQNNMLMDRNNGPFGMNGMNGMFGFPGMHNRLLNADGSGGTSFCSSSVISMSSGPDGRPQIYQATSSSKTGPNGIRETRKTVQDSMNGVKKMAIGHHIGERAHIIEKEQDLRSGQLEERQEFINLDEEEAELFDREFTTKANPGGRHLLAAGPTGRDVLTIQDADEDDEEGVTHHGRPMLALLPAPHSQSKRSTSQADQNATTSQQQNEASSMPTNNYHGNYNINRRKASHTHRSHTLGAMPRRSLRSVLHPSPLVMPPTASALHHHLQHNNVFVTSPSVLHPHPYKNAMPSRRQRAQQQQQQQQQTEQLRKRAHLVDQLEKLEQLPNVVEDDDDNDEDDDEPQVIIEEPEDDDEDEEETGDKSEDDEVTVK